MGFGDYQTALAMRGLIKEMVTLELDRQRPRYQMATVVSIDRFMRRCTVQFLGDPSPATVSMGGIQPSAVGQVVRVEGLQGDRFIADVMGAPFELMEERLVALESDPSATANFATNGNMEAGRDGWSDFWSGGTPKPVVTVLQDAVNAYSGNAVAKLNLEGDDTHYVTWQQTPALVNPGEVIQISWREKATAAGLPLESQLGANFGPTSEGANFFGVGVYPIEVTTPVQVATTNYVLRRTSIVVPSGHNFVRFHIRARVVTAGTAPVGAGIYVDDFRMQRIILQGSPSDPVIFSGTTQFTGQTWAWAGLIFPTNGTVFGGAAWSRLKTSFRYNEGSMVGGGIRTVTSTGISWDTRIILTSANRSSNVPDGYFDVLFPANGTVITGYGGATNKTVASGLIPLSAYDALFYSPPWGNTGGTLGTFYVVNKTSDYTVPDEWVLIAVRDGTAGKDTVRWFDGREQDYWRTASLIAPWAAYGGVYTTPAYKRENGMVFVRGLVKSGASATDIFVLPVGYRPSQQLILSGTSNAVTTGAASAGTAHTHLVSQVTLRVDILTDGGVQIVNPLMSNAYVSLDSIMFPAEA